MERDFKKIIVARTDRIGDVVLSLPVFASLKKCLPGVELVAMVRKETSDIVRLFHAVDRILLYQPDDRISSIAGKFRDEAADVILALYPRFRFVAAAALAGIPIRVGTAFRWYSFLFNKKVREHRKDSIKHEAEYNISLAATIGCGQKIMDIDITPEAGSLEKVTDFLSKREIKKFIMVHPGSGGSARAWPESKFRDLVKEISGDLDIDVLVTGTEPERGMCNRIASGNPRAIDVAGQFSLTEFIALLSRADIFISNSTGPIHLSAAVGTPVVGIYPNNKPMSPGRWAPLTERKIILTPKDGSDDVASIPATDVVRSILELTSVRAK